VARKKHLQPPEINSALRVAPHGPHYCAHRSFSRTVSNMPAIEADAGRTPCSPTRAAPRSGNRHSPRGGAAPGGQPTRGRRSRHADGGAEAAARGVVSPPRRRRRYRAGRRASSAAPCRSCHRCAPRDGRCEYGRGAGTWRRGCRGPSPSWLETDSAPRAAPVFSGRARVPHPNAGGLPWSFYFLLFGR